MKKTLPVGLVFSGGGTCGAYQIGFWKALKEKGLDVNVNALSGSSVGSLNALLFANGDIDLAADIWTTLKQQDMFRLRPFLDGRGVFCQMGYSRLIDRIAGRWEDTRRGMPIYSCISVLDDPDGSRHRIDLKRVEGGRPQYICLNDLEYKQMKNVVLASSAVPYVYPHRHVKGLECIDGDFSDKTPYSPLVHCGCKSMIVLHLNTRQEAKKRPLESDEDYVPGTDIRLWHLYPKKTLGVFLAVSDRLTADRMARGYEEGLEFLEEMINNTHKEV